MGSNAGSTFGNYVIGVLRQRRKSWVDHQSEIFEEQFIFGFQFSTSSSRLVSCRFTETIYYIFLSSQDIHAVKLDKFCRGVGQGQHSGGPEKVYGSY